MSVWDDSQGPDYFAISVSMRLSRGFSSRLFRDIRTLKDWRIRVGWYRHRMGSARHAALVMSRERDYVESIKSLDEEISDLTRNRSTRRNQNGRKMRSYSFIFRFDSPGKVLQEKMAYEFYGYRSIFWNGTRRRSRK